MTALLIRTALAIAAALLAFLVPATAQNADGITHIANVKGIKETPYATVRGWKVVGGKKNGKTLYCAGEKSIDGWLMRMGFDNAQWQFAFPFASKKDWEGGLEIDGVANSGGIIGVSEGKWTFAYPHHADMPAIIKANQIIIGIGKQDIEVPLDGAAATKLKIEECLERGGVKDVLKVN